MKGYRSVVCTAFALALAVPAGGDAQIRASERGSVRQTLDGTTVTVDYARPVARGRTLFGEGAVVPYGVVWTPGANWATTLETDRAIRLNGVSVPAGAYSMWMIPRADRWTLSLHEETEYFHFQKPDSALGTYHIEVLPETAPHVEMLTWSFPAVSGDAATLRFQWGETAVPIQVLAEPTRAVTLADDERAEYVGVYGLEVMPGIGYPTDAELRVTEGPDGVLRGWMSFPVHPGDELAFDMIPAGPGRFNPGLYRDGRLFNIEIGVAFEFADRDGVKTVVFRGIEGTPFGTGARATKSAAPLAEEPVRQARGWAGRPRRPGPR